MALLEFSIKHLFEIGFIHIVVIRLEVAQRRRHRIETVVGNSDGLGVLEFRERLRVESEVDLTVVTLRRADVGFI